MSLLQVIRSKCKDCCCDQLEEIKNCTCINCPLHAYRMGKNPFSKRKGSPDNLRKYREQTSKND